MDIDQEIARLINELGELSQDKRPVHGYDNLTGLNVRLLGYILFTPTPPTMRDIAETIDITLPSTSVMVDRLVAKKLLVRVQDNNDRRVVRVELTSEAKELMETFIAESTEPLKEALLSLDEIEKRTVMRFFKAYTDSVRNQHKSR